jgi:TetR/AcrR family transcriptional regulator, mexJK operon transcriptional repressor
LKSDLSAALFFRHTELMTIPDSPRAQAKRQQITDAARRLFLSQGYARTSTDAITRAAGVSKQTLYSYFPGKVELLSAVIAGELSGHAPEPGTPPDPQTPDVQTLSELRAWLLRFARRVTSSLMQPDSIALLRLLIGEAVHLPELRGVLRRTLPAMLIDTIQTLLTTCAARGLLTAPAPELSARMFVGPIMSFIALDGLFGDAPPVPPSDAALGTLVDLFLLTVKVTVNAERTFNDPQSDNPGPDNPRPDS